MDPARGRGRVRSRPARDEPMPGKTEEQPEQVPIPVAVVAPIVGRGRGRGRGMVIGGIEGPSRIEDPASVAPRVSHAQVDRGECRQPERVDEKGSALAPPRPSDLAVPHVAMARGGLPMEQDQTKLSRVEKSADQSSTQRQSGHLSGSPPPVFAQRIPGTAAVPYEAQASYIGQGEEADEFEDNTAGQNVMLQLPSRMDTMSLHNRGRSSARGVTGSLIQRSTARSIRSSEEPDNSSARTSMNVSVPEVDVIPVAAEPAAMPILLSKIEALVVENVEASRPAVPGAPVVVDIPVEANIAAVVEAPAIVIPRVIAKPELATAPCINKGDKGEVTQLACNFLRLNYREQNRIQEYHVDFVPFLDGRKQRRRAIDQFETAIGTVRTFDGMMLFLPAKLADEKTELVGMHPGDPTIKLTATITFVKEKQSVDLILFFNILFKKIMLTLKQVELRRNYYDILSVVLLDQHKLEIWPGFCIAIEEREGGLMICLDASHRVLRTETVLQYMQSARQGPASWKESFTDYIVGKIVLTRYNNMCYKIDDVIWDANPTAVFMRNDEEISYVDYYRTQYDARIKDLKQPLLLSKVKPRRTEADRQEPDKMVALIPELCYVTGLTDEQRSNFSVMKDLGNHTRLQPADRRKALEKFVKSVNDNPVAKKILTDWNLELDGRPMCLEARNITGPKLNFGKMGDVAVKADFSRESTQSCNEPVGIGKYLVVCTQRDADRAKQFVDKYRQVAQALGIKTLVGPVILPIKGYQVNDFRRAIKENLTSEFQFLLVVMPQQREDVYSLIKKTCVSELGIPSQVVLTKTLSNEKRFTSVVQKIALQINCKLGGSLWSLNMPLKEQVMFVGIDVSHDAKRKYPSILALVVNMDNQCTKYYSLVRIMKVHQEVSDLLESAFTEALKAYYEVRGVFPGRIIVWRDGGSISSVDFFKVHEVGQMQKAIDVCCPSAKFSYVVIQKRIGQRFFQTDRRGENWRNPDPGTIIDHTVTTRNHYDFFVVSQLVRQGTVTPTHYVVISDNSGTKPDLMQKLAYVTSFMYYNWSGTIRVPAMTQYAHKLAGLVGQYVRAPPGKPLVRTLYYL